LDNYRLEIEELILVSFLNQDICMNELDKMEYEDFKLPYNLFNATRTNKLVAKAIFNLQEENKPVSDLTVHHYITEITYVNQDEYINLISKLPVTFDTMQKYLDMLAKISSDEEKLEILRSL
tara:strand:- start:347 stop:712 length:366 start_codon:yes stop_codon:yes gene_type:complete